MSHTNEIFLRYHGFFPPSWEIVRETEWIMEIRHKHTGDVVGISKVG
jgi:hypothetical protein